MKYETTWKLRTTGTATAAGRNPEATGIRSCRDRPHLKNHPPERVPLAEVLPTRWLSRSCSPPSTRASAQTDRSAETGISGLFAKRSLRFRICHRSVDLPAYRPVDRAALRRALPRRCDPSADGFAGFFPLRSPSVEPSSVTRQPSSGGCSTTGPGSSVGLPEGMPTWFSSMKQASCCTHWFGGHGHLAARRRCCGSELDTTGVYLRSADCLSRPAVTAWDGTCSSMWTARSDRSRSLPFCVILCGICRVRSLWSGIIWELTKVVLCVSGCVGAGGFMWNTCRGMLLSLIPTSMDGPILRPTLWRTTARRMLINCMRRFWLQPKKPRNNSLFSVLLFTQPDCLLDLGIEHYFYRYQ